MESGAAFRARHLHEASTARKSAKSRANGGHARRGAVSARPTRTNRRRAIRLQDSWSRAFSRKLEPLLDYHNFVLTKYWAQNRRFCETRDETPLSRRASSVVADVRGISTQRQGRQGLLFEGRRARFWTSITALTLRNLEQLRCRNGGCGGIGPQMLHYVLGITRRIPRASLRAVPTELDNAIANCCASADDSAPPRAGRGAAAVRRRRAQALIQINGFPACASPSSTCSTA